ncbi:MAG: ATP-dependent zinc metalloprotease FtsH [Bacteroidetes bacterium]|nr:MAG: ATP-dependent zinc metalloprotease FtsH [Bacteroidota bacterium]
MSEDQNIKDEPSKPEGGKKELNPKEQFKKIKSKLPKNSNNFNFYWIYIVILVGLALMWFPNFTDNTQRVTREDFVNTILATGDVKNIVYVNEQTAEITIKPDRLKEPKYEKVRERPITKEINTGPHYTMRIDKEALNRDIAEYEKAHPGEKISISPDTRTGMNEYMSWLLPVLLIVAVWFFLMRRMSGGVGGPGGGNIFSIGKSKAALYDKDTQVNVTFNDVAGLEEAKIEIKEIVDFLKSPKKYTELGAKIPKGALLVGAPGTGKTLLAKAVAGEAKVPFFSLSGSDFVEMFVGVGASRVRDLFRQAKEKAPCIVFIDEIDGIGRARGRGVIQGGNDERESTLNQLLTEMDGFGTNTGVILLAATNRADILDRALLRPGRFDRQIYVDLPDLHEREQIFKVHIKPIKIGNDVDTEFLARQTPGFSGADIANICNEAALIAARKDKKIVERQDFLDAVDRVIGGLEKKNKIISSDEKKVIAYHEAGHATVSWLLEFAHPLVKVTIVPRGKSLGAAWYLPEERQITTREQMQDEICAALGGRAAEEVIFGRVSTGALSDLEKITKQAYAMVMYYGLNEKIGNISFYDSSGNSEMSFQKPFSEKTAERIDAEVSLLIEAAYVRAKDILTKHKEQLKQLAQYLLEKEVIFKENLEEIFGKRLYQTEEEKKASQSAPVAPGPISPMENGAASQNGSNGSSEKKITDPKSDIQKDTGEEKQKTLF